MRNVNDIIRSLNSQGQKEMEEVYTTQPKPYPQPAEPTASTVTGGNMNKAYLQQQANMTANNVEQLANQLNEKNQILNDLIARRNGGQVANESAKTLQHNLNQGLPSAYRPGNVGDLNKVVWPFWFTDSEKGVLLRPNQSSQGQITITQEAAFILVHYTKAVFIEEEDEGGFNGQFTFIDPSQDDSSGKTNGLSMTLRDSQSSRTFHNLPININQVGYWRAPTVLPRPIMFLPNSNIELTYQNDSADVSYKVFTTFFGYRLRIEDAQNILSLVEG